MEKAVTVVHGYLLLVTGHHVDWDDSWDMEIRSWFIEKNSQKVAAIMEILKDFKSNHDFPEKSPVLIALFKKGYLSADSHSVDSIPWSNVTGTDFVSLSLHKAVKVGDKVFREVEVPVEFSLKG